MVRVVGSFVVDLTCRPKDLPRPGETVASESFAMGPGGKGANQAVAAARAGAKVVLSTKVGKDALAKIAWDSFEAEGFPLSYICESDTAPTGAALIAVSAETGQNLIVVAPGACLEISDAEVEAALRGISARDVLVVQLEIRPGATEAAVRLAKAAGARVLLNPAPAAAIPRWLVAAADWITPNETEAESLTGVKVVDAASAERAAEALAAMGARNVLVTLGSAGVFVLGEGLRGLFGPFPVAAIDTTGAGDAFSGSLAAALVEGMDLKAAVRFASAAAALSTTKAGTAPSMARRSEIEALLAL